ncbi:MAG: hypothetical protein V4675_10630 [Verrucomicrobiota bacterium]
MKQGIFTTLLMLSAGLGTLRAARVTFETFERSHQFVQSDGVTRVLPTSQDPNSTVIVGYLTTSGEASTFRAFGESSIENPYPFLPIGGFLRRATQDNAAGIAGISELAGKRIVLWVFGQNGEQGMFTSSDWTVPSDYPIVPDRHYVLRLGRGGGGAIPPLVTTIPLPGFSAAAYAAPVSLSVNGETPNTNASSYILGRPIPEPSVFLLTGFAGVMLFCRRRPQAAAI